MKPKKKRRFVWVCEALYSESFGWTAVSGLPCAHNKPWCKKYALDCFLKWWSGPRYLNKNKTGFSKRVRFRKYFAEEE